MATIADYFKQDLTLFPGKGITFYVFDNSKATSFVQDCLVPFRQAYISDEDVERIITDFGKLRSDVIARRIPKTPNVKSGDFAEILTFYLACQTWASKCNVLPMKWRFKDKKPDASSYTDVILFDLQDSSNPSPNDAMITFEVKSCASPLGNTPYKTHKRKSFITYKDGKPECTILEAVFDANKDAVERAAETIPYLLTRCEDCHLNELHDKIYRFSIASKVTYQKKHNAVAVVDLSTLNEQINRMPSDLLTAHPMVNTVYCIPIDKLRDIYEKVYSDMPTKA